MKNGSHQGKRAGSAQNGPIPTTITFRLDEAAATALTHEADNRDVSAHQLAKQMVLHALSGNSEFGEQLADIIEELGMLRRATVLGFEATLVAGGKTPAKDAENWVMGNFGWEKADEPS